MIRLTIALCVGLCISFSSFSQRTDGKVTLVQSTRAVNSLERGINFQLYKGAIVYLNVVKGNKASIQVDAYIKDVEQLPAVIYSDAKYANAIGKLLSAKKMVPFSDNTFFLQGDVNAAHINVKDLPEWKISELIRNHITDEKSVKAVLSKFEFRADEFFGYDSYFFYEQILDDPSPNERIRMLFKNGQMRGVVYKNSVGKLSAGKKVVYNYNLWVAPSVKPSEARLMAENYSKFRRRVD